MPRKTSSQWEFGDLFDAPEPKPTPEEPPEPERKKEVPAEKEPAGRVEADSEDNSEDARRIITVSQLTSGVRRLLENEFRQVWVTGEITNLRRQSSGHIYFTLKDSRAQLSCILWRGERVSNRDLLEDGSKVLLQGDITVYEPRGQYQLRVQAVELQGVGALQAAFEKLKKKLQAEGLFAQERKRNLPRYPQRIGLVTSATGAAIRDVIHVMERRQPGLEVILAPCRVQGQGAAEEIAQRIALLNDWAEGGTAETKLDLILVTRGGGSLEDLWAFNEEVVARAVFSSVIPVVSAIGHEIDFTICDFVADLRAATPSAAAEIITEGVYSSRQFVYESADFLARQARRCLEGLRGDLGHVAARLDRLHPRRLLNEQLQRLDELQGSLVRGTQRGVREQRTRFETVVQRLLRVKPALQVANQRQAVAEYERRMQQVGAHRVAQLQADFKSLAARLKLLGPDNTLERGYSITADAETGEIVRSAAELKKGSKLRTRFLEDGVISVVEETTDGGA